MTADFILDASLTLRWCFADERTPAAMEILKRMSRATALVPLLWFSEVGNGLIMGERRRRITSEQVSEFIALLNSFDLEVDTRAEHRSLTHVLAHARTHTLSVYDATYLDLAKYHGLALATADGPLRKAAEKVGVVMLGV